MGCCPREAMDNPPGWRRSRLGLAFSDCSSLAELIVPGGAVSFWSLAFERCVRLVRFATPERLTMAGSGAVPD
jgi:hypothetical protein